MSVQAQIQGRLLQGLSHLPESIVQRMAGRPIVRDGVRLAPEAHLILTLMREDATLYFVQRRALMIGSGSWDAPSLQERELGFIPSFLVESNLEGYWERVVRANWEHSKCSRALSPVRGYALVEARANRAGSVPSPKLVALRERGGPGEVSLWISACRGNDEEIRRAYDSPIRISADSRS